MEPGPYLVWIDEDMDMTRMTKSPYKEHYVGDNKKLMQTCLEDAAEMLDKYAHERFVESRLNEGDTMEGIKRVWGSDMKIITPLNEIVPVAVALFESRKEVLVSEK